MFWIVCIVVCVTVWCGCINETSIISITASITCICMTFYCSVKKTHKYFVGNFLVKLQFRQQWREKYLKTDERQWTGGILVNHDCSTLIWSCLWRNTWLTLVIFCNAMAMTDHDHAAGVKTLSESGAVGDTWWHWSWLWSLDLENTKQWNHVSETSHLYTPQLRAEWITWTKKVSQSQLHFLPPLTFDMNRI